MKTGRTADKNKGRTANSSRSEALSEKERQVLSRLASGKTIKDTAVSTESWVRRGDAIVDEVNGRTPVDFIAVLKNQSDKAWLAVKTIVFNPVINEKNIKALIREKKFVEDELFGKFVEWMMVYGGIDKLKDPTKFVAYYQKSFRDQLRRCVDPKVKRRGARIVFFDDLFVQAAEEAEVLNPIDKIRSDEILAAGRNERLMEDEKAIVRRCFVEFWKKHPKHAIVLCLRNMGLSAHEIKELVGESTDNNVSQLARRGGLDFADLIRAKKVLMPGVSPKGRVRSWRLKHD